jgi:peptidoglycan-associated lipoprotein
MRWWTKNQIFIFIVIPLIFFLTNNCAHKSKVKPEASAGIEGISPLEETPPELEARDVSEIEEIEADLSPTEELKDIFFDFDRATIRAEDRKILERNAEWLKANPKAKILIEGHCDERGTIEYNLALGDKRANAVRNYLISLGVDPTRMATISYGEEKPFDPGHNEEAWAKNRRAHFVLTNR